VLLVRPANVALVTPFPVVVGRVAHVVLRELHVDAVVVVIDRVDLPTGIMRFFSKIQKPVSTTT